MSGKKIRTIAGHIKEVRPMEGHKLDGHEADLVELLKKGVTKETIARIFGVTRPTLYYFLQSRDIDYLKDKKTLSGYEKEITEMFNSGCTLFEMSHHFHVHQQKLVQKIKELGLTRKLADVHTTRATLPGRYEQVKELLDKGMSTVEIAKALGISYSNAYSYVAKFRTRKKLKNDENLGKQNEQIKELFDQGMSTAEIARTLGISYSVAYSCVNKFGPRETPCKADCELVDKREIIAKMHNIGISTKDIASVFECAPQSIRYRLNAVGIKMDTRGRTVTA